MTNKKVKCPYCGKTEPCNTNAVPEGCFHPKAGLQEVEGVNVDEMLKGCEHDGSYIPVSEIRRLLIKCAQQSSNVTDEDIEKAAKNYDRRAYCGHYAGEEPSYHFKAGAKAMRDRVIKKS